jgi:hypothetical protein
MKTFDLNTECKIGDKTAAFIPATHLMSGCVKDCIVNLLHLFMVYLTMPSVSHTAVNDCTIHSEWWIRKYVEGLNRITKAGSDPNVTAAIEPLLNTYKF